MFGTFCSRTKNPETMRKICNGQLSRGHSVCADQYCPSRLHVSRLRLPRLRGATAAPPPKFVLNLAQLTNLHIRYSHRYLLSESTSCRALAWATKYEVDIVIASELREMSISYISPAATRIKTDLSFTPATINHHQSSGNPGRRRCRRPCKQI